jgi:hypothetical protein
MSLASGVPAPLVFVLDREQSINAFAAGTSTQDAVVCVTQGTLQRLSRDELQGVIAHEFSHIFNGDMRLNIRLMGVLEGILFIGSIGMGLVRAVSRGRSSSRKNNGGAPLIVFGLALAAIGYIGVFFGRLIKSTISRKREFLADASSVQYTRNPAGLLGAFVKMTQASSGLSETGKAEQLSHMFFGPGLKVFMNGLFATHPPLYERVAVIDEQFAKEHRQLLRSTASDSSSQAFDFAMGQLASMAPSAQVVDKPKRIDTESIAAPQAKSLERAQGLLTALAGPLLEAARSTKDSKALAMALVLGHHEELRSQTLWLQQNSSALDLRKVLELKGVIDGNPPESRLSLLELTASQLRLMSTSERQQFYAQVSEVAKLNTLIDAREAAFLSILYGILIAPRGPFKVQHKTVREGARDIVSLLWLFASATTVDPTDRLSSFNLGVQAVYGSSAQLLQKGRDVKDFSELSLRIDNLRGADARIKSAVCKALLDMAQRDSKVHAVEWELLKAVMSALAVPMPRGIGSQFMVANS